MEKNDFFLIAGPCVIESKDMCMLIAEKLCRLTEKHKIPFFFKASFRKDNRTRYHSYTGIGDKDGLEIIHSVKEHFQIPVTTDIHTPDQAQMVSDYGIDLIQIPAFLCRQTSLLKAAAQTGRAVNVKKGQFLAPEQMEFVVEKLLHFGMHKENIMLTERGTQFGYKDLVFDVRSIPTLKKLGVPVVMDITHSVQVPNQEAGFAGGRPEMIFTMAATALAAGADALFVETHPSPQEALSDGSNMLLLSKMDELLQQALAFRNTYKICNKK